MIKDIINIKNEEHGITLMVLVVTIIVLIILAGITIVGLTGETGLMTRTKEAKVKATLSNAKEEVQIAINGLIAENYDDISKITPKMISDEVNKENKKETIAENETTLPTNIIYPSDKSGIGEKIKIKIDENLEIIEVKSESGITIGNSGTTGGITTGGNQNSGQQVDVGNVNVTITDVKATGFTINAIPESPDNIAMYQYYVDGNLVYEGLETTYSVKNLQFNTDYNIEVKVIPMNAISVATTQQKTLEEPIIEMASKFDKIIYINSISGSDTTGDGSRESPYATLDKIADSGIIENGYSYGIILGDGTYALTTKIFELSCNQSINIIGNRDKTTLKVNGIYSNAGGGRTNYSINIYRLIWDGNNYVTNNIIAQKNNMNLYAVVFNNITTDGWTSYFYPISASMTLVNCTISDQVLSMLRTTEGTIKLTNCYGGFTSGYGTSDSAWNYKTNYITSSPNVNSTTYEITENESIWKNVGTGTNLDGTQADLGVYGGDYSWEYKTDLD